MVGGKFLMLQPKKLHHLAPRSLMPITGTALRGEVDPLLIRHFPCNPLLSPIKQARLHYSPHSTDEKTEDQ